jgi:Sec-independent protein translocase protein TatA
VQDWIQPVFELAIVVIGDQKVPSSVDAFGAKYRAFQAELAQISWSEALD